MPPRHRERESAALRAFRRKKVLVVEELAQLLASSIGTARRRLKEWDSYTSYNHNGRYYVLPSVAKFDPHGLWRYRTVFFSKHGNLKQTVIYLVNSSPAGLSTAEIGELVRIPPRSFLSHFREDDHLQREKIKGRFVYFSSDRAVCAEQKLKRIDQVDRAARMRTPTDAQAVVILVERIQHPALTIEELSARLGKKKCHFTAEELSSFLELHGLLKKTQDTQRYEH